MQFSLVHLGYRVTEPRGKSVNFHSIWDRKARPSRRRDRLRNSSSELAIEFAEPRLLLSSNLTLVAPGGDASAVANAIVDSIHTNLEKLGDIFGDVQANANQFDLKLPMLSSEGGNAITLDSLKNSTNGKLLDIEKMIQDQIVTPIENGSFGGYTTRTGGRTTSSRWKSVSLARPRGTFQLNTHAEGLRMEDQGLTDLSTDLRKSQGLERNSRRERISAVLRRRPVPSFFAKSLRHSEICAASEIGRERSL